MEQRLVLVKYGEIHLKGLNRPFFKRLLRQRLTNNLEGLHCEVREMQGRVFVSGFAPEAEAEVVEQCANTFGVVGGQPRGPGGQDLGSHGPSSHHGAKRRYGA